MIIKAEVPDNTTRIIIKTYNNPTNTPEWDATTSAQVFSGEELQSMIVPSEPCEYCHSAERHRGFLKSAKYYSHCPNCGKKLEVEK